MRTKKQLRLEQSIEKTINILSKLDMKNDIEEVERYQSLFNNCVNKYIRRYKNREENLMRENVYKIGYIKDMPFEGKG